MPDHHRQGYASEAAELMVEYGFEYNDASQKLLEGLGFVSEGVHRESAFVDGEYQDTLWYSLLADEYPAVTT